jgi:hypothetical protein
VRWPRLKRRRHRNRATSEPAPTFTPGSWAQAASPVVPPEDAHPHGVPTGNAEIVPPPVAGGVSSPSVPAAEAGDPAAPGVRLGFADGSTLDLDPQDPHSAALRAVAEVLVERRSVGA